MPGNTIQLYAPPGITVQVSRRKTNTSKTILLTVNKDDVVQRVADPLPEPLPPGTIVYSTGYVDGYHVV